MLFLKQMLLSILLSALAIACKTNNSALKTSPHPDTYKDWGNITQIPDDPDDTITCNFTEPFITYTYERSGILKIDNTDDGVTVVKNVKMKVLNNRKKMHIIWDKENVLELVLDYNGSDGMSPYQYPYSAGRKNSPAGDFVLYGGCYSTLLARHNDEEESTDQKSEALYQALSMLKLNDGDRKVRIDTISCDRKIPYDNEQELTICVIKKGNSEHTALGYRATRVFDSISAFGAFGKCESDKTVCRRKTGPVTCGMLNGNNFSCEVTAGETEKINPGSTVNITGASNKEKAMFCKGIDRNLEINSIDAALFENCVSNSEKVMVESFAGGGKLMTGELKFRSPTRPDGFMMRCTIGYDGTNVNENGAYCE